MCLCVRVAKVFDLGHVVRDVYVVILYLIVFSRINVCRIVIAVTPGYKTSNPPRAAAHVSLGAVVQLILLYL